jgi:hypothetical protein
LILLWKILNGLENDLGNFKIVEIALGNSQIVIKLVRKYQNGLEYHQNN